MNERVFRKKSLDSIKSPEVLDDYIHVANPSVWILLASIIILLAGACVWGVLGHIESTVPASIYVENGDAVCYISDENIISVKAGMTVRFSDNEAEIVEIGRKDEQGYPCMLSSGYHAENGYYEGKIITKSAAPFSFILN